MKHFASFTFLFFILYTVSSCAQNAENSSETRPLNKMEWSNLSNGLDWMEIDAPKRSEINDSKITIVRIQPEHFEPYLLCASEFQNVRRTAKEWADTFDLNLVINAGMYELSNGLINRGYMQNKTHWNNPELREGYNSMIALSPVDSATPSITIIDLKCSSWGKLKTKHTAFAQGMRMIDCNGTPLSWNKKNQSCSMLIAAMDAKGALYFIFSRSPYTHNDMISFLLSFPFGLRNAIYLEGGPETSLYLKVGDTVIEKIGSYVSQTYPNDDNLEFWKLPNVIGLKLKTNP
jgi:hypothetical protein